MTKKVLISLDEFIRFVAMGRNEFDGVIENASFWFDSQPDASICEKCNRIGNDCKCC